MTNPNDPAFPSELGNSTLMNAIQPLGLTKREYFAAMAMQGMINSEACIRASETTPKLCENAVFVADALIEELSK